MSGSQDGPGLPESQDFESLAERRILEAQARGDFDGLEGQGRPLRGLQEPYDEDWWIKAWIQREDLGPEALWRRDVQERVRRLSRRLSLEAARLDVQALRGKVERGRMAGYRSVAEAERVLRDWALSKGDDLQGDEPRSPVE